MLLTRIFRVPNTRLHTIPSECRKLHEQAVGTHQTHRPSLYLPLPALGTLWLAVDPSVPHLAAGRFAAPVRFAEPTTQQHEESRKST